MGWPPRSPATKSTAPGSNTATCWNVAVPLGWRARRALALTPSEQRVAELAASGMTNRDIAATLFITIKTVEHNLSRVYAKLGIRSRAELGRRMDQLAAPE